MGRDEMQLLVQHLKAPNDRVGNPRRLWVVMSADTGGIVRVIDEGYGGKPESVKDYVELPAYDVKASNYNELKRRFT